MQGSLEKSKELIQTNTQSSNVMTEWRETIDIGRCHMETQIHLNIWMQNVLTKNITLLDIKDHLQNKTCKD